VKGAKPRRVGKKKFNQLINEEINKVEAHRPARVKRNGVEVNQELQEDYIKDKEELAVTSSASKRPLTKFGSLKTSYFSKPCIYMLYRGDKIVYIGQTECLARRIAEHLQSDKEFDSFVVHSFIEDNYVRLKKEQILIRKHRPAYNVVHK
jgi:predicted metal-binding transcription factor (methanogenesis marker protein 9)